MDAQQIVEELSLVLTQQAIADALMVDQSTVSRWSNGKRQRVDFDVGQRLLDLRRRHARAIAKRKAAR